VLAWSNLFVPVACPEIHAYAFNPNDEDGEGELIPIETEEEWDLVEEMLNTFLEEQDEE